MASEIKPGGGVRGSPTKFVRAQEEDICRRTSLYPTLVQHRYPLELDEVIYTPNVKIVKTANYERLSKCPNIAGVVTSAAIRRPVLSSTGQYSFEDRILLRNKIRMLLETFEYHGITHLVLGAWGCGVFRNPPRQVALEFWSLLSDRFKKSFARVTFAVAVMKDADRKNYDEFCAVFQK